MTEIKEVTKLSVKYNGVLVGTLYDDGTNINFQYNDEWIKNGFSISPLSLPLSDKIYTHKNPYNEIFGVFQDTLPDGWGILLTIRELKKYGINYEKLSILTKLSLIQSNGLGGLTYEPIQSSKVIGTIKTDLDEIFNQIQLFQNDELKDTDIDNIYRLGGSSGGARPKIHLKNNDGLWIVKFPCSFDPKNIGSEEYKMNLIARKAGVNVPDFKLFPSKLNKGYFGSKRFDIDYENNKRIHFISLCGLLETTHRIPNLDYMHLFKVIKEISANKEEDKLLAYKQMCFNVIYENKDDHGKNFGFIFDESIKGYRLSPAYDLTRTKDKLEHEMTIDGVGKPTIDDCIKFGTLIGYSKEFCLDIVKSIKEAKR